MRIPRIITAAGISLFALSTAACVHEHRDYYRPGYDYRHDGRYWDHDRRFYGDRRWDHDYSPRDDYWR